MAFEQDSDATSLHPGPAIGADQALDELPEPRLIAGRTELGEVQGTSMDLITEAIGEAVESSPEILVRPAELPDLKDQWLIHVNTTEAGPAGTQSICEEVGIPPIILGSGHRVPAPEAVELLQVEERAHVQPTLQESLTEPFVGAFDRDNDPVWLAVGQLDEFIDEDADVLGRCSTASSRRGVPSGSNRQTRCEVVDKSTLTRRSYGMAQVPRAVEISGPVECFVSPVLALAARTPHWTCPRPPARGPGPPRHSK